MIKMKYFLTLILVSFIFYKAGAQINFTSVKTHNYIYTKTRNLFQATTGNDSIETMQYFDGLGRPSQVINYKGSPKLKDVIHPFEYDAYGRESYKYTPYSDTISNASGIYRADWKAAQSTFYTFRFGSPDGSKAYSQTMFDGSPLNIIRKQGFRGSAWQPDLSTTEMVSTEHVLNYEYSASGSTTVYYWTITGTYPNVTFSRKTYASGALFKKVTYDENRKYSTEYKDKQGNVIMKSNSLGQTYYIYDDFNLLRCVIPPLAIATIVTPSDATFALSESDYIELCYYYEYDSRNRMVKKKLPGTIGIYEMTYDALDRLISTKDPNGTIITTAYDIFSRPVKTINTTTGKWMTKTFFDSYPTLTAALSYASIYNENIKVTAAKGKVTVTDIRVLNKIGTIDSLRSVTYFDKYGRVIQTVSENQKGGINRISYRYKYKNNDLVAEVKTEHSINGSTISKTITEAFAYDVAGRLLITTHTLTGQTLKTLSTITYNESGQVAKKVILDQAMINKYNIRGWLTNINTPNTYINSNLFNELLDYSGYFNGNIAHLAWNRGNDTIKHYYFSYDAINRMGSATYKAYKSGSINSSETNTYYETYTYDANGNILTAKRNGVISQSSPFIGLMDDLNYVYINSGKSNRLYAVGDAAGDNASRGDFYDASNGSSAQEYYYDNNGNMKQDKNKNSYSLQLTYNYLNLIEKVSVFNGYTNYSYTATGEKLGYNSPGSSTKVEYVGPFVYKNDLLNYIITSEGRIVFTSAGAFDYYEYHLKDHLGNVRVVFKKNSSGNTEVIQKDDYYPFGLLIKERTDNANNKNKYLYNGKEFLTDMTLNYYDYGARMYDPQLGRWHRKDPLMEWHFNYSPYAYCFNNPISYIDPNGMDASLGFQNDWNGDIASKRKPKPPEVDPVFPGYPIPAITVTGYTKKPEKKGFWGFVFFIDGYSDGSESTARPVSWDRVLGFIDISFIQDMFDAFWRGKELHKKIKDTDEKMAGKGIKRASQTPDKDINPNNKTNADVEEIDDQGQPTNRIIDIDTNEIKSLNRRLKTFTITREDSIIYKVVTSPGDTTTEKWKNKNVR